MVPGGRDAAFVRYVFSVPEATTTEALRVGNGPRKKYMHIQPFAMKHGLFTRRRDFSAG